MATLATRAMFGSCGDGNEPAPAFAEMVNVAGGTFTMGATSEQGSDYDSDELPTHSVTLTDFKIGKYEVTQKQWWDVMGSWPGAAPKTTYGKGDNYPMYNVSHDDIQSFLTALNAKTGMNYRLPTEAEWEYAARGGNLSKGYKYSGSNTIGDVAWYDVNSYKLGRSDPAYGTHVVGTKSPNELGIYDMSGNVWEWCSDWYGGYSGSSLTNPAASSGSYRVGRGCSWHDNASYCRVSNRNYYAPDRRYNTLGFRLALSL
ncbi:hypothetical protein FACS1894162_8920 [Bacteroidia bacterium]|nr:hypothetical protein FACS1894162_8920 [Bacteroidia bacterium]